MSNVFSWAVVAVVATCLGCGSSTAGAPSSIAGTWEFQVIDAGQCEIMSGTLDNNGGIAAQFFDVSQSGQSVSASFVDNGGNLCSLSGTYAPDEFKGQLEVAEPGTGGRVVRATVEGYARNFEGRRQVDGWARVDFDSDEQCLGEVIEFCAIIDGEGQQDDGAVIRQCPPVDIVFIMDTSGSMDDEAEALCNAILGVEQQLRDLGLEQIRSVVLGITRDRDDVGPEFDCLTDNVYDLMGGDGTNHPQVPGNPWPRTTYERNANNLETIKPFELDPNDDESDEFWAPATALIAENYNWLTPGTGEPPTVKIIVPISDESPQTGRSECWTVDEAAIDNAARVAVQNGVRVSPIYAFSPDRDECIAQLGQRLASRTGGLFSRTSAPVVQGVDTNDALRDQIANFIFDIVLDACEGNTTTIPLPPLPADPPQRNLAGNDYLVAFNEDAEFYVIDRTSAVASGGLEDEEFDGPVSSAVWRPNIGQLWIGMGGEASEEGIFSFDLFTREATLQVDTSAVTNAHPGLTIDQDSAVWSTSSSNNGFLFIDSTSANVVGPGAGSGSGKGLAFVGDGFVTSRGNDLFSIIDPTQAANNLGAFNPIGFPTELISSGWTVTAMANTLSALTDIYVLVQSGGGDGGFDSGEPTYLARLDLGTRNLTMVGRIENPEGEVVTLDGLAFMPTSVLIEGLPVLSPRLTVDS